LNYDEWKHNTHQVNFTPVIIITSSNATRENNKLTRELVTFEIGKIYFGTYVFFIKGALAVIDPIAIVVDSVIKLNIV
jgi:hypothetical protein